MKRSPSRRASGRKRRLSRRAPVLALALASPLILSSPGLGSDPAASAEAHRAEAGVCRAAPAAKARRDLEQLFDRLVVHGEMAGTPNVVVLNNQGNNYGPPALQLERIRLEALEAEAELRRGR